MKTASKILSLLLIAVMALSLLTSCASTLNGTYASENDTYSLTFDKDGNVEGTFLAITLSGATYEIDGENIKITYKVGSISTTKTYSFSKDGDTITIDNITLTKKK